MNPEPFEGCIPLTKTRYLISSLQIQLKALQTLESVFQCRERSVAFPFINALAPHIVMILNDMCVNKPTRDDQLTMTLEAIKIMEILVDLTEDHLSTMFFCFLIYFFFLNFRLLSIF